MHRPPQSINLDIEAKYAEAIFSGRKTMEFRRRRLPLQTPIRLLVDGDRVGWIILCWEIRGSAECVWDAVGSRSLILAGHSQAGITLRWLQSYAGDKDVSAYGIIIAGRYPREDAP